jgi:beta-fructofuranosidase
LGEAHCFSGCAWINGQGQPMLFYTMVGPGDDDNRPPNQQWAAYSDADMVVWHKHLANPILSLETHGGPAFKASWRDPFIFSEAGRIFMVVGGDTDTAAMIVLYEAEDDTLTRWNYRSILIERPLSELRFFECPNFIKIDDKWLLLTAPYRPVEYYVGDFDLASLTFRVEQQGILDYGYGQPEQAGYGSNAEFYATNILFDQAGPAASARCVLLGWIRGFKPNRGWNGCLALPRLLTLGPDGHPRQQPVPEIAQLRGAHTRLSGCTLTDEVRLIDDLASDTFELTVNLIPSTAESVGIAVRCNQQGEAGVVIRYQAGQLDVAGTLVPLAVSPDAPLKLHLFVDKSVLELFVNDGEAAITRVIYPPAQQQSVALFAAGGAAQVQAFDAWEMQPIW